MARQNFAGTSPQAPPPSIQTDFFPGLRDEHFGVREHAVQGVCEPLHGGVVAVHEQDFPGPHGAAIETKREYPFLFRLSLVL